MKAFPVTYKLLYIVRILTLLATEEKTIYLNTLI